jgi:hypothetical protein
METETFFEYQNIQDGKIGMDTHKKFWQPFLKLNGYKESWKTYLYIVLKLGV